MQRLKLRLAGLSPHHIRVIEVLVIVVLSIVITTTPAYAGTRLLKRSLYTTSSAPGATADYTISFTYNTEAPIGSVDIKFCIDPIPYMPCDVPAGFDFSNATLASQTGETGFVMTNHTANHVTLSRPPSLVLSGTQASYTFIGVKNPTFQSHSFSARLGSYESSDASGPIVDIGSVIQQMTNVINIETQVPPMLIFCMAAFVNAECTDVGGGFYTDMGTLSPDTTLTASSQMGIGTNASGGFVVTINGTTMQAGQHTIKALDTPTASIQGVPQFGINLRANDSPNVGLDATGDSINANPTPNYDIPNKFMFKSGDVIASAPNVSLVRRFTMSYIVNSPEDLAPGVYTTTLTYICSARF